MSNKMADPPIPKVDRRSSTVAGLSIWLLIAVLSVCLSCTDEIPLADYKARNAAERKILFVLIRYQEAKNQFNLKKFLACLHEAGEYSYKGAAMVSKEKLKASLPGFWATLNSQDRSVLYPLSHEFVTGDFYPSGRLTNPQMTVHGDTAAVTVTFASGWWRQKHYISMVRVDHRWQIIRLEWEEA